MPLEALLDDKIEVAALELSGPEGRAGAEHEAQMVECGSIVSH